MNITDLLFIDSSVDKYEILLEGIAGIKTVILESDRDGVTQITEVLSQYAEVENIQIVSHGSSGTLYLGNSELSLHTIERYTDELKNWFSSVPHLSTTPSLFLYGCSVAAGDAGIEFITKLHQLTGANIAASAKPTGNAALGGDWNLEVSIGNSISKQPLTFPTEVVSAYPFILSLLPRNSYNTSGSAYNLVVKGNYAYIADGESGLSIVDISNPNNPTLVSSLETDGFATGITVKDNYAYIADDETGLLIVNISNPSSPTLVSSLETDGFASDVTVDGNYAYIADDEAGLSIVNISNPNIPTLVGSVETNGFAINVTLDGNYAYVADDESGLSIIDIRNPNNPTLVGNYNTSGIAYNVAVKGNYAYVADDESGLSIIDISNPNRPNLVSSYDTPRNAYDVVVEGDYAYIADGESGVQILNISNPSSPVLVGSYDTSGSAFGLAVIGKYIYVADDDAGVQILENNTLPTAANKTVVTNEDTIYTFTATDFNFTDSDSGDRLQAVQITQLPTVEGLFQDINNNNTQDNNEAITVNQTITVADLSNLKFKPAPDANGKNYANFQFKVSDGSEFSTSAYTMTLDVNAVDDAPPNPAPNPAPNPNNNGDPSQIPIQDANTPLSLKLISNNTFQIEGNDGSGKPKLEVSFAKNSSNLVNELGVFVVDDEKGTINGIALGTPGYTEAALARAKVVFSSLAEVPNGFDTNLTHRLEFNSGERLRFFLVKNSTIDAVQIGQTPLTEVLFSDTSVKTTDVGNGEFSLGWKDTSNSSTSEFEDLVVKLQATNQPLPLGAGLQENFSGELIDLRDVTNQVKAEFVVNREAAFDNFVGFYRIADVNGGIDSDGNGTVDFRPGDEGYARAAIGSRVAGVDLTVKDQSTASFTATLSPGSLLAPFVIANGKPDAISDNNANNDPAVYFTFLGANSGQVDHVRLLGNNTFGFEDLPNGGDKDYNDMTVRVNLSIA